MVGKCGALTTTTARATFPERGRVSMLANNELATLPPGLFATGSALLRGANVALGGNPLEDSAEPVPSTFRVDDATVSCARAASHLPPSPRPR